MNNYDFIFYDTLHVSSFSYSSTMSTLDVSNRPPVKMLFTTALAKYPEVTEYLEEIKSSKTSLCISPLSCEILSYNIFITNSLS